MFASLPHLLSSMHNTNSSLLGLIGTSWKGTCRPLGTTVTFFMSEDIEHMSED